MFNVEFTYRLVLVLMVIGMIISTLEYLVKVEIFNYHNGLLSWKVVQTRWGSVFERLSLQKFADLLFTQSGMKVLLGIRLVTLMLLPFVPVLSIISWVLLGILLVNIILGSFIAFYGTDGSDQMNAIIISTLFLCSVPLASPLIIKIGLWFIGLQACLSYTVAGISKLVSSEWRGGTAVRDIFSSKTYGTQWAYTFLQKDTWVNTFICWNVIIIETLFPLCLFLPWNIAMIFLIWGALFHLFCAVIMGLNSFLWAFIATYPAILFIHEQIGLY